ncbi:hypothetical protein Efla_006355 [Eimeria flavescens]
MRVFLLEALATAAFALAAVGVAAEETAARELEVPEPARSAEAVERAKPAGSLERAGAAAASALINNSTPPLEAVPRAAQPLREAEQFLPPSPPAQSQRVTHRQTADPQRQGQPQRMILGALRLETLVGFMTVMQQRFFQAILPDSWAVPKFLPSVNADLEEVHRFLQEVARTTGAASVPAALIELAESGRLPGLLQGLPSLPPALKHLLATSTAMLMETGANMQDTLAMTLPTLREADLQAVSRLFRVPSELEYPVSSDSLVLFLPVVVRNAAGSAEPPLTSELGGPQDVVANIKDILVPVVDHEGQILFADAASVFHGIDLPSELPVRPLALFTALEDQDVSGLWSAVKAPMMSKLSLLGSDAPALFGPVMTLASLPRVALSLNGENQAAEGPSQLATIVADVSSRLRPSLRTFDDLVPGAGLISAAARRFMREPLDQFLNLRFLNFFIPVVGLARVLEAGALLPLKTMSLCSGSDCPLGLSLPRFPEFLVSPATAISQLQQRAQALALQLQAALQALQRKIESILPQGVAAAAGPQGVSLLEVLNTTVSLTRTLQTAVDMAGERVNGLLGVNSAAAAATTAATMQTAERTRAPEAERGLLAPRRKLQGGLIDLPVLNGALDLRWLELPGQGSLQQLLSLRELTSAVEDFVPLEGSPLLAGLSPKSVGRSLGSLFKDNQLPDALLQQPLASLLQEGGSGLPASLANLNVGQFLSLSSAVDKIFESPLVELPNLATLSLNPSALLSLPEGAQGAPAVNTLSSATTTEQATPPPPPVTNNLFF